MDVQKVQFELSDLNTTPDSFLNKVIFFTKFAKELSKKVNMFIATFLFQFTIVLPMAISFHNCGIIVMGLIVHFITFKIIVYCSTDIDDKHQEFCYALKLMLEEKASRK
jgi:hypothetical protein